MVHPNAATWLGLIVAVIAGLTALIVWGLARHQQRHHGELQVTLVAPEAPSAGQPPATVTFVNLRVRNLGSVTAIIDGLGYRRIGSLRLVPVRRFDAPSFASLAEMADLLAPPPYRLAPGETRDITLYAPALCSPEELSGLYLHLSDGELVWLPHKELERLIGACHWVSAERPAR